jgi:hypothetical protein
MSRRCVLVVVLLTALSTGCGDGDSRSGSDPIAAGSCTFATGSYCMQWSQGFFRSGLSSGTSTTQDFCALLSGGAYSSAACPSASRVGTCTVAYPSYTEIASYYPGAGTAASLKAECEAMSFPAIGIVATWHDG